MDSVKKINLIQTKTAVSPQLEMTTTFFRRLSFWVLTVLIVSGIAVSGIFYYLQVRKEQLVGEQRQRSQAVAQSTTKEGLLASVKQRAAVIHKILGVQKPVGRVFDMLIPFVSPDQITAISLDDHHTVSLVIHAQSIIDVVSITDALVGQTTANLVRAPQLVSLSLGRDGGVDVGLSFIAVF